MSALRRLYRFYDAVRHHQGQRLHRRLGVEGDTMCFKYGEDPATCWNVRIAGDQVAWVKDGVEEGTGTILPGIRNNF